VREEREYAVHAEHPHPPPPTPHPPPPTPHPPQVQLSAGFGDLLYDLGMATQQERAVFRAYEVRTHACAHHHGWTGGRTDGWIWASGTRASLPPPPHAGPPSTSSVHLLRPSQARIRAALDASNPLLAYRVFDEMLNGDEYPFPTYYANVTGMKSNYFNFEQVRVRGRGRGMTLTLTLTNYFNFEQGPDGSSLTTNHFIAWLATAAGRPAHSRATCTRTLVPANRTRHEDPYMRMPHAHATCTSHACARMHRHGPLPRAHAGRATLPHAGRATLPHAGRAALPHAGRATLSTLPHAGRAAMNVGELPYAVENATVERQLLNTWMVRHEPEPNPNPNPIPHPNPIPQPTPFFTATQPQPQPQSHAQPHS
jgi:hypothetical protein